jgi:hypothetical protein
VVEALEALRIALPLAAHLGAAVGARVEQRAHDAVLAAHEDDPPHAELARAEVARIGHLGLVAEIEPAAVEDPRALGVEHLGIEERLALDAEGAAPLVDVEIALPHCPRPP